MANDKHVNEAEEREVATSSAAAAAPETTTTEATETTKTTEGAGSTSAEIIKEMDSLARRMGIYSEGVDYLIENGAPDKFIMFFSEMMDSAAAETVAKMLDLTGSERARLMERELRTDDEKKLVQEVALRASAQRLDKYIKSNYTHSLGIIADAASETLGIERDTINTNNPEMESLITALNMLNRYFYVKLHPELNPLEAQSLSEAEEGDLIKLTHDYIAFHKAQSKPPADSVIDFVAPAMGDISELTSQSDTVFLPLALAFRDQTNIGKRGAEGALVNVGKPTDAGTVNIEVYISDKDGKPLSIDAVMKGVQSAIGQLIDENGRRLPLIVTPQQVYRAYARLPNDSKVTAQQAAEMERAMDALMFSPSRVDFTAQLEKHKKIKHQSDYDYSGKDAGRLTGNLIPMTKGEGTNRQGERHVAYKIYDYPVLYRYSHIVGQIAQVPNKLITGGDKGAIKDKKTAEAQRNALNIGMRKVVMTRITLWRSRIKQHRGANTALLIQEIADDCGLQLTEKTERTLRKNVQLYLDELKAQGTRNGGIKNYIPQKDGRRVVGFYVEM